MSLQPAGILSATGVNNNEVVRSNSGNKGKSAKSDFTKPVRRVEKPCFLTPKAKQAFTQLK